MKNFFLRPKTIAWILFLILFVVTIVQNSEPTPFKFLFWSFAPVPKLFLILGSMLLGSFLTLIISWQCKKTTPPSEGDMA